MSIPPEQREKKSEDSITSINSPLEAHIEAHNIEIDRMLCFALYAASRATTDAYRPLLDALGLTYPQYLVMVVLWERETCAVRDIGHILHLDSGTLSPLLKRLENAGFIKRQRRSSDERIVDITLTDKGRDLSKRAVDIPAHISCKFGIEFDEYRELLRLLKKVTEQLSAVS